MNGGQVATRGFLLQTLIALWDVLGDIDKVESIRLEPSTADDKTDFVIEYVGGRTTAVQVKSSQNQIGLPSVKTWAKKLKADLPADEYELRLIGPISSDLAKVKVENGVMIPTAKSLDVDGMLEQATHRLDVYLHKNGMNTGSPLLRKFIVEGLVGKLSVFSTSGTPLSRVELQSVFRGWMETVEQQAIHDLKIKYGDGTLTDVDALKEYAAQFDRAALQDSLRSCWCYKRFGESLGELIALLNTGQSNAKFVTKRRADFGNQKWRSGLDDLYHDVRSLRELYSTLVKSGEIDEATCGCKCSQSIVVEFEDRKRRIIQRLNDLLIEAGITPIRGVP